MIYSDNIREEIVSIVTDVSNSFALIKEDLYFGDVWAEFKSNFNQRFNWESSQAKLSEDTYNTLNPELFEIFTRENRNRGRSQEILVSHFIADGFRIYVNRLDSSYNFYTVYTPFILPGSDIVENTLKDGMSERCLVSTNFGSPGAGKSYEFIETEQQLARNFLRYLEKDFVALAYSLMAFTRTRIRSSSSGA